MVIGMRCSLPSGKRKTTLSDPTLLVIFACKTIVRVELSSNISVSVFCNPVDGMMEEEVFVL